MADFLCTDRDDLDRATEDAERDLAVAKAVAALAVAQAHRSQIELREALEGGPGDRLRLAALVARLEEEQARARGLVADYHEARDRVARDLARLGDARRAATLNEERAELRAFVTRAQATGDEEQLARLEAEVRAEAAGLDVLEALDRGVSGAEIAGKPREPAGDVEGRARALIDGDAYADLWSAQ